MFSFPSPSGDITEPLPDSNTGVLLIDEDFRVFHKLHSGGVDHELPFSRHNHAFPPPAPQVHKYRAARGVVREWTLTEVPLKNVVRILVMGAKENIARCLKSGTLQAREVGDV
jgi:hypothetical protein